MTIKRRRATNPHPRSSEWLLIGYFILFAVRAAARRSYWVAVLDFAVPLFFLALATMEGHFEQLWAGVLRDWAAMPFLLLAYWNSGLLAVVPPNWAVELRWVQWDRVLLDYWYGRQSIESCGVFFPATLELAYLLLYAIPPVLLGCVYKLGGRRRADAFLFTVFAGTLVTYALLPLFPSASPWIEFPGSDLPSYMTVFRRINLFVLQNFDVRGSVFPSGHVTVAFSCMLGVRVALPEHRWLSSVVLLFALMVTANTIYGRYHYAVDAAAGVLISFVGYGLGLLVHGRGASRQVVRDRFGIIRRRPIGDGQPQE